MKHHAWPCWVRCKSVGWRCVRFDNFDRWNPGYVSGSLTAKFTPWKVTTLKWNGSFFCFLHVCDWHVLSRFLLTHVLQEVCTLVLFFCVVNLVDLFVFGQIPPAGCDEFLYRGCGFGKKGSWRRSQDTSVLLWFVIHLLCRCFEHFDFYPYLYHGKLMENDPIWLAYFSWMDFFHHVETTNWTIYIVFHSLIKDRSRHDMKLESHDIHSNSYPPQPKTGDYGWCHPTREKKSLFSSLFRREGSNVCVLGCWISVWFSC